MLNAEVRVGEFVLALEVNGELYILNASRDWNLTVSLVWLVFGIIILERFVCT